MLPQVKTNRRGKEIDKGAYMGHSLKMFQEGTAGAFSGLEKCGE